MKVSVRKRNGCPMSFLEPSKKKLTIITEEFHSHTNEGCRGSGAGNASKEIYDLNEDGNITFQLDIPNNVVGISLMVTETALFSSHFSCISFVDLF